MTYKGKILGLDLSKRSTAWTITSQNKIIEYGVIRTQQVSSKKFLHNVLTEDDIFLCAFYITNEIIEVIRKYKVDKVIFENRNAGFGSAGNQFLDLATLHGCVVYGISHKTTVGYKDFHFVPPTSLKKFAKEMSGINTNGKGNNKKQAMIDAIRVVYGEDLFSGYTKTGKNGGLADLADATWCCKYLQYKLDNKNNLGVT